MRILVFDQSNLNLSFIIVFLWMLFRFIILLTAITNLGSEAPVLRWRISHGTLFFAPRMSWSIFLSNTYNSFKSFSLYAFHISLLKIVPFTNHDSLSVHQILNLYDHYGMFSRIAYILERIPYPFCFRSCIVICEFARLVM